MKTVYKVINVTEAYAAQFVNLIALVGDFGLASEVPENVPSKTLTIVERDDRWVVEIIGFSGTPYPQHDLCRHVFSTPEQIAIDFLTINSAVDKVKWLTENVFTESGINNPETEAQMRLDPELSELYLCLVRSSLSPEQIAEMRDLTFESMITGLESDTDAQKLATGYIEHTLEMCRIMDFSAQQTNIVKALLPAA